MSVAHIGHGPRLHHAGGLGIGSLALNDDLVWGNLEPKICSVRRQLFLPVVAYVICWPIPGDQLRLEDLASDASVLLGLQLGIMLIQLVGPHKAIPLSRQSYKSPPQHCMS